MLVEDVSPQSEAPTRSPETRGTGRWLPKAALALVAVFVLGVVVLQVLGEEVGSRSETDIYFHGLASEPNPQGLTIDALGTGAGCLEEVFDERVQETDDEVRISAKAVVHNWCSFSTRTTFELERPIGDRRIVNDNGDTMLFDENRTGLIG